MTTLDGWPDNRYAQVGAWGTDKCWITEKCVRLGNPDKCSSCGTEDGNITKTISPIEGYHNFNFSFYWSTFENNNANDQCKVHSFFAALIHDMNIILSFGTNLMMATS